MISELSSQLASASLATATNNTTATATQTTAAAQPPSVSWTLVLLFGIVAMSIVAVVWIFTH